MSGFFGFRLPVVDGPTAIYAVRMAGLPVLLVGASAALRAVLEAVRPDRSVGFLAACVVAAVVLVAVAFRMRAGRAAWVPFAAVAVVAWFLLCLLAAFATWQSAPDVVLVRITIFTDLIVPVLCMVLLTGGLRGWWWLRRRAIRSGL
ncbi:hypothetical protein [Paragemmobacter aquarius]|nr:hypothetical protein [Gemmobacter aquarius]